MTIPELLSRLEAMERRFDGPIPRALRCPATGSAALATARARSALFDRLAGHATTALARTRAAARSEPDAQRHADQLALYRQTGLAWRDLVEMLARS